MITTIWTDAAYQERNKKAYIAYVIKNSEGTLIETSIREVNYENMFGSSHVELVAMDYAMKRVIELNLPNPQFYSDEQNLLGWIENGSNYMGLYEPTVLNYVNEIHQNMDKMGIKKQHFNWIESKNNPADKLMKSAKFKSQPLSVPKAIMKLDTATKNLDSFRKSDASIQGKNKEEILAYYESILEKHTLSKIHLRNARPKYGATRLYIAKGYVFIIKGHCLTHVFKNETIEEILRAISYGEHKKEKIKYLLNQYGDFSHID